MICNAGCWFRLFLFCPREVHADMAKEFAKRFYNSPAWERARNAYLKERIALDAGLCELCHEQSGTEVHHKIFLRPENIDDPNISLNPENFELLCYRCHKLRHEAARRIAYLSAQQRDGKKDLLKNGCYYIDESGNVQPFRVFIVWGAPGAGKTTYVREHMLPGDMVIDLDAIGMALSLASKTDVPQNIKRITYDIRDFLYQKIADRNINARNVWVIAGLPERDKRHELANKLSGELVFIPSDYRTCYLHALHDDERQDKAIQLAIIDRWFRDFEPD